MKCNYCKQWIPNLDKRCFHCGSNPKTFKIQVNQNQVYDLKRLRNTANNSEEQKLINRVLFNQSWDYLALKKGGSKGISSEFLNKAKNILKMKIGT